MTKSQVERGDHIWLLVATDAGEGLVRRRSGSLRRRWSRLARRNADADAKGEAREQRPKKGSAARRSRSRSTRNRRASVPGLQKPGDLMTEPRGTGTPDAADLRLVKRSWYSCVDPPPYGFLSDIGDIGHTGMSGGR